jgi:hypothetical protein
MLMIILFFYLTVKLFIRIGSGVTILMYNIFKLKL